MTTETTQKIEHTRKVLNYISTHEACPSNLKNLLQNILFFILDFKFEEFDHAREWLAMYDLQANLQNTPFTMYPPIHPDYIVKDHRFEKEFKEIKDFFEFARCQMQKVGA